jgi:hypothetical protein
MGAPIFRNRDTALYVGLALWLASGLMLWDAFENRGHRRPLPMRLAGALL